MIPFTIVIISHGHLDLLRKCLGSLKERPQDSEILIIANGVKLPQDVSPEARIIETQDILSPGKVRNLALDEAQGGWLFFLGEDAYLGKRYWEILTPLLEMPKVDVIGGPLLAASGMGAKSLSLHLSLASPFCTGATFSRYQGLGQKLISADEEKLTDQNLWIKREALKGHRFPEDYLRGEEILLLQELKLNGSGIFYHPRLSVFLYQRALARDFFWEGFYRSKLIKAKLAAGSEVFWLPSIFVLMHLSILMGPELFLNMFRIYGGIIVFVALGLSMRIGKPWLFPFVAFFHYFVVFIYGVGFLAERVKFNRAKGR